MRFCFHRPVCAFLVFVLFLVFTSGCAFMDFDDSWKEIPNSPSSVYVPGSSQSEPFSIQNEEGASLDGRVLGLAECIKIALARNPKTRQSWQRIRSAAAGVDQVRSAYFPSADFTAGASRADPVFLGGQRDTGPANTFDAGFGVRYLLFDGGVRSAGLKSAEAELLGADFQHNATLQDVALQVEEAYYQLPAAREFERVAQKTVQQTQYHVDVTLARYQNGLVSRSDVLKAKTEKAEADLQLVTARSQVRIVRGQLAHAMGLKPSASFKVAKLPQDHQRREIADIKRLMAEATMHRPELRAALARIESNRAKVREAKASYWPRITFNLEYGWRDRSVLPDRDEWSLGVGLTLPLFDGLNRKADLRRSQAELAEKKAELEKLSRGIELEVWTAYSRLIEAGQAIEAARALVASAEESARVTEGEYKNGTASIIDVTDAQTARTTANVRLVQARLDWYMALARLERSIGRTLVQGKTKGMEGENRN